MRLLLATMLLAGRGVAAQRAPDEGLLRESLPTWSRKVLEAPAFAGTYVLDRRLNPYFQQGDFDADGRLDLAVLIVEKATGKHGMALLRRAAPVPIVLGAGRDFGNGGDDWSWMDVWRIEEVPGAPPGRSRHEILAARRESGGGLIRWDGRAFRWRQAGD